MKFLSSFDWVIFVCLVLLCGLGAAIIASVAPEFFWSQIIFYAVGLALFSFFVFFDFRVFPSLAKLIYLGGLILLGITLFLGLESRGAIRWIALGPFHLQFSEILKPLMVVAIAGFLVANPPKKIPILVKDLFLIGLPILFVLKQPDLGSAIIYFLGFLVMLFFSDLSLVHFLGLVIISVVIGPFGWHFLAPYQKQRLASFVSPQADPLGSGYNAIQALITVGSGMWLGRGLGRGTQSHLLFLPERHTDFIFASAAEEFGFLGVIFLLALYFILIWRIFQIAKNCDQPLARLICIGIGAFLLTQVFINVGMNIGLLPVTGITLPLLSYGGSSVLSTMIGLGIVENVSVLSNRPGSSRINY